MGRKKANSIYEIHSLVGQIVIDIMIYILMNPKPSVTKFPLKKTDNLIKNIDYEINFKKRDDLGRFKKTSISFLMPEYGLAVDKGRQGTEGNRNVRTKWSNGIKAPPLSAMIGFIKKRGLQTKIRNKKTGRFISVNSIAFMLMNSIRKNGINPRNFIQPSIKEGEDALEFYLDSEFLNIVTKDFLQ